MAIWTGMPWDDGLKTSTNMASIAFMMLTDSSLIMPTDHASASTNLRKWISSTLFDKKSKKEKERKQFLDYELSYSLVSF